MFPITLFPGRWQARLSMVQFASNVSLLFVWSESITFTACVWYDCWFWFSACNCWFCTWYSLNGTLYESKRSAIEFTPAENWPLDRDATLEFGDAEYSLCLFTKRSYSPPMKSRSPNMTQLRAFKRILSYEFGFVELIVSIEKTPTKKSTWYWLKFLGFISE